MKKFTLVFLIVLISFTSFGQDITGQWNGALKVQGTQLRLIFKISNKDNGLISTMDSPDQGAEGILTTTTSFENSTLKITLTSAKIEYEGILGKDNIIVGNFKQAGQIFQTAASRRPPSAPLRRVRRKFV